MKKYFKDSKNVIKAKEESKILISFYSEATINNYNTFYVKEYKFIDIYGLGKVFLL